MIRIIIPIQTDFLQYTFLLLYNTIINSEALRMARAELHNIAKGACHESE